DSRPRCRQPGRGPGAGWSPSSRPRSRSRPGAPRGRPPSGRPPDVGRGARDARRWSSRCRASYGSVPRSGVSHGVATVSRLSIAGREGSHILLGPQPGKDGGWFSLLTRQGLYAREAGVPADVTGESAEMVRATAAADDATVVAVQRRTLGLLFVTQVLGGAGMAI